MSSECPQLRVVERCDLEQVGAPSTPRPRGGATAADAPLGGPGPPPDGVVRRLRHEAQGALGELLRAFQQGQPEGGDAAFRSAAARRRLHAGLVTALMRLILLLYAEARGLLSVAADGGAPLARLFDHLEAERRRWGADLERRHGAWPRVEALSRALLDREPRGARGGLLDPETPAALRGRPWLSDGVLHRVLSALVLQDGEPVRYGELEIEHIGTLYEGLIAFDLELAEGESMALLPRHAVIDLEALLRRAGEERLASLLAAADLKLGARRAARVAAATTVDELARALARRASPRAPGRIARGALYLQPGQLRRRAGSYYTPREITRQVVERTLAPLLERGGRPPSPGDLLSLAVCDPAMGSGAFLVEACRQLAAHLAAAWERSGVTPHLAPGEPALRRAMALVAERCLHGVDLDPIAVDLARVSLWLAARDERLPPSFLDQKLRCGDSLLGAARAEASGFPAAAFPGRDTTAGEPWRRARRLDPRRARARALAAGPAAEVGAAAATLPGRAGAAEQAALDAWMALWFWPRDGELAGLAPTAATFAGYMAAAGDPADPRAALSRRVAEERRFLHWELAFPGIFERPEPGFDAVIGNPPWVAYVGRAAQPIEPQVFHLHLQRSPAFHGYRSLHGLFVHRAASLLRPGGRLGLVIPTSVADLAGYGPTRRAHDALCAVDPDLPSFGSDAFEGVFQPCMGLLSTRVAPALPRPAAAPWPLARSDLDVVSRRLLERLGALRPLPAALFGERGFQTTAEDAERIRRADAPAPPYTCPIREGTDVGELIARAPRHYVDRGAVKGRFRKDAEWRAVRLLIRQTARYPIAALSDGLPFRNSILAGFCDDTWSEFALLCYLNSSPVRWWHYTRHRDAREGMPQVKIAHLRAIPAPRPALAGLIGALDALGRELGPANAGLSAEARRRVDDVVASMLEMTEEERACVARWAAATPPPRPDG
ncbi:hypothetical protein SOCEGT47_073940 [Sorangium cellulosum]|uniref:site-specific DNA-methyltransferase (adenine-specific) n=1 Tax=Sorangium cellulosum TaxID=56 RepID=A0A4P2QAW1_SORCE|nr:N-6 DNA methylase [Sorangium cellulosum]AUX26824.1 hypothetical protein SOCEGT47_073940 [Sorangium cellulosum]